MHVFADVNLKEKQRETSGNHGFRIQIHIILHIYVYIILNRENVKDGLSFQTRMVQAPFGTNYIYN